MASPAREHQEVGAAVDPTAGEQLNGSPQESPYKALKREARLKGINARIENMEAQRWDTEMSWRATKAQKTALERLPEESQADEGMLQGVLDEERKLRLTLVSFDAALSELRSMRASLTGPSGRR